MAVTASFPKRAASINGRAVEPIPVVHSVFSHQGADAVGALERVRHEVIGDQRPHAAFQRSPRRAEARASELRQFGLIVAEQRVLEEQQHLLLTATVQRLFRQFAHGLSRQWLPWRLSNAQNARSDFLRLLILALAFEFLGFPPPVGETRRLILQIKSALEELDAKQVEQSLSRRGFDHVDVGHSPGRRHVERVDVELEYLQRLVALVAGAREPELPFLDLLGCDVPR